MGGGKGRCGFAQRGRVAEEARDLVMMLRFANYETWRRLVPMKSVGGLSEAMKIDYRSRRDLSLRCSIHSRA